MALPIEQGFSLAARNTLAVPAMAEYFAEVEGPSDALEALAFARDRRLEVHVLGGGSNVVLGHRVSGLWLHPVSRGRDIIRRTESHLDLCIQAGESWHELVAWSLEQGAYGLENLALIPGCVGAAPIQNIGAYGVELERYFLELTALDLRSGERRRFKREDCGFAYRDSVFKGALRDRYLIESVSLRLPVEASPELSYPALASRLEQQGIAQPTPRQVFEAVVAIRSSKLPDPAKVPNAGSFFKNPVVDGASLERLLTQHPGMPHFDAGRGRTKLAAGWLIEECGFKQFQTPVRVHPEHALVLINPEARSGEEVQQFASEIVAVVRDRFGLELEQEPRNYV